MALSKSKGSDNNWMSFSDMMTGLMVIFMFIAISYILQVQRIFIQFEAIKKEIHDELNTEFKDDFKNWEVDLDEDLSIKFKNPDILFQSGKAEIRPNFAHILDQFLPRYFKIILQPKYKDKIAEIRIEGHTDTDPAPEYDPDPYIGNIKLSQLRSAEVLKYFRKMDYYSSLSDAAEQQLQSWITANGLSFGRTLDADGKLTLKSGKSVNNKLSRRVEFRIVPNIQKVVDEAGKISK